MAEFKEFPKMPRLNRDILITEKIDGTNAAIVIEENVLETPELVGTHGRTSDGKFYVTAQSRSRALKPGKETDNFGFAAWVEENKEALKLLGPGYHYGEWFGASIQRGYGMNFRGFALFDAQRWMLDTTQAAIFKSVQEKVPTITTVPILYRGPWVNNGQFAPDVAIEFLRTHGSVLVPGYGNAEGIVVYHHAGRHGYKATLDNDAQWKGPKAQSPS